MKIHRLILIFIIFPFLPGCPVKQYGLGKHYAIESYSPDFLCIETTLKSIHGINNVSYRKEVGGKPLTLHGIEKPDQIHRFFYTYNSVKNDFYFRVDYQNNSNYYHTIVTTVKEESSKLVTLFKPIIEDIEYKLEKNCNIKDFTSKITETCDTDICQ